MFVMIVTYGCFINSYLLFSFLQPQRNLMNLTETIMCLLLCIYVCVCVHMMALCVCPLVFGS